MRRGEVVLIYVPFVGASGGKRRPAVVQSDTLNALLNETVIVEITSNIAHVNKPHQVLIDVATSDGAATGLLTDSAIRCDRLHTVRQADVTKTIGALSAVQLRMHESALKAALSIA